MGPTDPRIHRPGHCRGVADDVRRARRDAGGDETACSIFWLMTIVLCRCYMVIIYEYYISYMVIIYGCYII